MVSPTAKAFGVSTSRISRLNAAYQRPVCSTDFPAACRIAVTPSTISAIGAQSSSPSHREHSISRCAHQA